MHDNEDENEKPDFQPIKDDPISVADQFDFWIGWLMDQGYSPLAIQSGLSMALADLSGFIYDTFEPDNDDEEK